MLGTMTYGPDGGGEGGDREWTGPAGGRRTIQRETGMGIIRPAVLAVVVSVGQVSCCVWGAGVVRYGRGQYKKQSLDVVKAVTRGEGQAYIKPIKAYLKEHPDDVESMYLLALLHARQGGIKEAMAWVRRAVEGGLPVGRFIAGPRELLEPLHRSAAWRRFVDDRLRERPAERLVHGPMVGSVTAEGAAFRVRTAQAATVRVEVLDSEAVVRARAQGRSTEVADYTVRLEVRGLKGDQGYGYRVLVDDGLCAVGRFRTAPRKGQACRFTMGFGGGAGYTPQHERMWTTIDSHDPAFFLMLGDNVYIDDPTHPASQRYCYYRRQSRPEWRRFVSGTPVYAIWDDHDFVTNDAWGGPAVDEPAWKGDVWRVFQQNWVNPAYGGGADQPGCWFDFYWGDVHVIMLDGRYYRQSPREANPSMLGPAQKAWLKKTLAEGRATFTVLASPVPWAPGTKPGSRDTWDGYAREREEIFDWIASQRIEGVILLSADRHRSDLWRIDRPGAYPLYEFESSRLTNIHRHGAVKGNLFSYNATCSFGKLTFDTTVDDPTVTYEIVTIDNMCVFTFSVRRSQLEF